MASLIGPGSLDSLMTNSLGGYGTPYQQQPNLTKSLFPQPSTNPAVLGSQNPTGTTTTSGGSPTPTNTNTNNNQLFETAPSQPSFDEGPFNDVINALSQEYEAEHAGFDATIADLTNQQTQTTDRLGNALTTMKDQTAQQSGELKSTTEADINSQRRGLSEVNQGIQAKYGGTTGTGKFASELVARTAFENIGKYKTTLSNNITKLNLALSSYTRDINQQILSVEQDTQVLKQKARAELDRTLSEINLNKANVGVAKSQQKTALLSDYRNLVSQIDARNTQYRRDLITQANTAATKAQTYENQLTKDTLNRMATNIKYLTPTGLNLFASKQGLPAETYTNTPTGGGNNPVTLAEINKARVANGLSELTQEEYNSTYL